MNTRCKPGDLCYIVNPRYPSADGLVVEIVRAWGSWMDLGHIWTVHARTPILTWTGGMKDRPNNPKCDFQVPDMHLRPITGLPLSEVLERFVDITVKVSA